jgi:phosphatidylethanolamine/phosphatidyl-N-methylethanolamine N-methyltransferase
VKFIRQFISNPITTGAIAPSSSFLARAMVDGLDLSRAAAVLEYGPGTGVFTDYILRALNPGAKFAAIELNAHFAAAFRTRHPGAALFEDSVENVRRICDSAGIESVDCIVSGLPWAVFPESMQRRFLDEMMHVLNQNGTFVTFAYVHGLVLPPARKFAELLNEYFKSVSRSSVVWLNVPPAFVYRCRR